MLRVGLAAAVVVAAFGSGVTIQARARADSPTPWTVPCNDIILVTRFPYVTGGYRVVLDAVAVPQAYLPQTVRVTSNPPWRYWSKAGLVVRAGSAPVTVSVPIAWRSRAAITWGNSHRIVSSLRIKSCQGRPGVGHAYAGGFYLRPRSACVPLVVTTAHRSATVRFGVGRHC